MKIKKMCPKCNGTDIILVPGKAGAYGVGNNIQVGLTTFSAVLVDRYVCCDCGFTEEWVDPNDMYLIKNSKKAKSEEKGMI